jgi:hypothetical protein
VLIALKKKIAGQPFGVALLASLEPSESLESHFQQ